MEPRRPSEPKIKVASRSQALRADVVVLLGLVVLLIGVAIGL